MSDWLMETFGMSAGWARGIQVVIAFVIVFALLAAFLWIMRRLTRTGFGHGGRTRQPRLAIMDQAHIDTRRRLVLVRRDNVEHLVLVGGPSDVVVEQNIVRGQSMAPGMRAPYPAVAQPMPAASVAPAAPQPPAAQGPVGPVAAAAVAVAAATDDEMPEPPAEAVPEAEAHEPEHAAPRRPAAEASPEPQVREAELSRPARPQQQPPRGVAPTGARERPGPAGQRPRQRPQHPGAARPRPAVDEAGRPLQQPGQPQPSRPARPQGPHAAQGRGQRQQNAEAPARPARPEPAPGASAHPLPPAPREHGDMRKGPRPAGSPAGTPTGTGRPAAAPTAGAERSEPAPSLARPSRGPAARLSESIFARGREATSSTAGSISAAIAAAAGLAGRKGGEKPADAPEGPAPDKTAPAEARQAEPAVIDEAPAVEPAAPDVIAPPPSSAEPAAAETPEVVEEKPTDRPAEATAEETPKAGLAPQGAVSEPDAVDTADTEMPDEKTVSGGPGDEVKPADAPIAESGDAAAAESTPAEEAGETVEGKPIDIAPVEPPVGSGDDGKGPAKDLDFGFKPEAKEDPDDAPTVEIDRDDALKDDKRSRENDSIEEEMAKLLSELSGSPDK